MGKIFEPLVSIVTPCYNHEKFLAEYFDSIVNQTYKNIEFIIIDDASKDKSQELIEQWLPILKRRFVKVTHILRKKNVGVVKNCNEGLQLACGKYICFFASDDIMLPNKIQENVNYLENNSQYGMIYTNVLLIKKDKMQKKPFFNHKMPSGNIFEYLLMSENYIPALSVCIRKDVFDEVGGYDEDIIAEDFQMWLKIAQKFEVGYLDKPLAIYRMHVKSLCNNREYKIRSMIDGLKVKNMYLNSDKIDIEIRNKILKISYARYAFRSFYFNDKNKFEEFCKRYFKIPYRDNMKSFILRIFKLIIKIPLLYKIVISLAYTYRFHSLVTIKELNENIRSLTKC